MVAKFALRNNPKGPKDERRPVRSAEGPRGARNSGTPKEYVSRIKGEDKSNEFKLIFWGVCHPILGKVMGICFARSNELRGPTNSIGLSHFT